MSYKLGLKPMRVGAIKLQLSTYMNYSVLPTPPAEFGHYDLVPDWGMLANGADPAHPDVIPVGDCAIAAPMHQTMLWCAESKAQVAFSPETAVKNYSEITGYNPELTDAEGNNPTDNGTALDEMAKHWQQTGISDDSGNRHKIVAFASLNPGDLRELWTATWLFQSVTLGVLMPDSAQQQFADGEPWDVVRGARIEGGHAVPCVGRKGGMNLGVTWGALHPFTDRWYEKYSQGGIVGFSEEMLVEARSIDGVDDELLRHDLAAFAADD